MNLQDVKGSNEFKLIEIVSLSMDFIIILVSNEPKVD